MRSLVISALLLAVPLTTAHSQTPDTPSPAAAINGANAATKPIPSPDTNGAGPPAAPGNTVEVVCHRIESAALANELPLEFLTRLIWQESRFDDRAISRAGAQGIAQFMPKTAEWIGLGDPFDAAEAIGKSAALLRSLRAQFGNLGLAAAAYNAGPKRVSDWLARRRTLPRETLDYVRVVTGHAAEDWTASAASPTANSANVSGNLSLPNAVPCPEIVKLFVEHRGTIASQSQSRYALRGSSAPTAMATTSEPASPWGVQLIGGPSQTVALASYYQMQKLYRGVLGSHQPIVLRSPVGASGSWYRVRVGADNRNEAERLCSNLRAAGGSCLVQTN